jgi:protein O-mannosyl-transferase
LNVKKDRHISSYLAATIALATFLVYLPALQNDYVYWDDNLYIFENPNIRSLDAAFFRWAFFGFHVSNWHPLTWISHAVDYALWGLNPPGHHLTSVILHAVNTALVVTLALRLFEIARERSVQNASSSYLHNRTILIAAAATGLLFGIHPVHVESVAWVSERKDLLCALFFLLCVMAYVKYARGQGSGVRSQESGDSGKNRAGGFTAFFNKYYLLSIALFILALMSKPMAVTLPIVLLILDWYPLGRIRSFKTLWLAGVEKLPFFVLSLASSVLTILAQSAGKSMVSMEFVPLTTRLLVAAQALIVYLQKMLLPLNLMPLYTYPKDVSLSSLMYLSALCLGIGVTAACAVLARKQKVWLSVWCFYGVTLIPVLGIIQVGNQPMADRYTYLPSLGPFLIAGMGAAWVSHKALREDRRRFLVRGASVLIALILVVCLSCLTARQTAVWRDSLSLWTYVIEKEPGKIPLAYNNRGMVFFKDGKLDQAIADFDMGITLDPLYAKAYYNRGSVYEKMGRLDKAIADYRKTISLDPLYYEAYYYLDQALKKMGQHDKSSESILPQRTQRSQRKNRNLN